jgi:hypothetical protein
MTTEINSMLFAVVTFGGILLSIWLGNRVSVAGLAKNSSSGDAKGIGAIEGALFGLLGLMIAFTFSGAASRF